MTSIGLLVTGVLNLVKFAADLAGHKLKIKTHRNGCSLITEVGGNWGGLELGAVALCGNYSTTSPTWYDHTRKHEFGHAIQHLIFGPLFIFVVAIPSASRYWVDEFRGRKNKNIFASCVGVALLIVDIGLAVLAAFTTPWLYILVGLLLVYIGIYLYWMIEVEIPKYDNRAPEYDSIWFEGGATGWGTTYIEWLEN
jgi:hypothetical protein